MLTILILCTGNSCRSILGEALINKLGHGRVMAYSAGSFPVGTVNPGALATLQRHGISTEGFASKSWNEFADKKIDIAITVCDNAAGDTCPVYLNRCIRAHWGLPDPAHVTGTETEIEAAFESTYAALERRIHRMLELPLETLSEQELTDRLNEIGKMDA